MGDKPLTHIRATGPIDVSIVRGNNGFAGKKFLTRR